MCGRFELWRESGFLESSRPNTKWRIGHDIHHTPRLQIRPTNTAPVLIPSAQQQHGQQSTRPVAELVNMKVSSHINQNNQKKNQTE